MAAQAFEAVVDINPNYYDAEKLYQDAFFKENADYYIAAAKKLCVLELGKGHFHVCKGSGV